MKKVILALACVACGDDGNNNVDAPTGHDGNPDAPSYPDAPALGAQIDRMGRPAINTALNSSFIETNAIRTAMRDKYNTASDPVMWATTDLRGGRTVVQELEQNLAVFDVLDQNANVQNSGCGNQALYTTPTSAGSYATLATVLADDQLYLDTSKTTCNNYLSLEVEVAAGFAHSQCGGRTPSHDVIDYTYSMLAAGVSGFELPSFMPKLGDMAEKHADVSDTEFPFLGDPH